MLIAKAIPFHYLFTKWLGNRKSCISGDDLEKNIEIQSDFF